MKKYGIIPTLTEGVMPKLFYFKHMGYFLGLFFIITGLVFVSNYEINFKPAFVFVGLLFVIKGANTAVTSGFFQIKDFYSLSKFAIGQLFIFLGLTILVFVESGYNILGLSFGLLALISSSEKVILTLEAKSKGENFIITLLYTFILTAFGLMLFWSSVQNSQVLAIIFGTYMMVEGSLIMLSTSYVREPDKV